MSDTNNVSIMPSYLENLTFDSFGTPDPANHIWCNTPVRTIIRREEEIILIRKVRKVEEIDVSPACPINTTQMTPVQQDGGVVYQEQA